MTNTPSIFSPITYTELQDPTVTPLNQRLQQLASQIQNGSSASGAWQNYYPTVNGQGMTTAGYTTNLAAYLQQSPVTYLNIDAQVTLSGSLGNIITLTYPVAPGSRGGFGNVFSCIVIQGSAVAGVAYIGVVGSGSVIVISRYDNGNFSAGLLQIKLTGLYQTN